MSEFSHGSPLYPLRFLPRFREYIWGGRRLESVMNKQLPAGPRFAESWEIVDHGDDQSCVSHGPLAGKTLHELIEQFGSKLLGPNVNCDRFPLLLKFLDAHQNLSVQVHPNDDQASRQSPPDSGKTEAWVVIHSEPGSKIYAGLLEGVNRAAFLDALGRNQVLECLHVLEPSPGDCLFIPAGTVHALGAGLVVAELQQSSDTTFRLYDWDRLGTDGKPRALHIDEALASIDFEMGPISVSAPITLESAIHERLVSNPAFCWDRWTFTANDEPYQMGPDDRCHLITVLDGRVQFESEPSGGTLLRGDSLLLPACCDGRMWASEPTTLLDGFTP